MKVILLRDVAKIGRRNQIVDVPDGYAINQLIPKKWAEAATAQNLKKVQSATATMAAGREKKEQAFASALERLATIEIFVVADANQQGHLFKAVHEKDIVEAMKEKGAAMEIDAIKITAPIKSLGAHQIRLVHGTTDTPYTITISKK
jgi:large subunit ribosomal protein L9